MSNFVSIVFCRVCHSRYVEIIEWPEQDKCIFHCRTCNTEEVLENFTLGRGRISSAELQTSRDTRALPGKAER